MTANRFVISLRGLCRRQAGVLTLLMVQALALALPSIAGTSQSNVSPDTQRRILLEPGAPVLGSVSPDVTVVEYFDYNCPFCRALAPAFHPLIANDHAVAVLYKEWPIFGGVSIYAAESALAAGYQGKYLQAHDALIGAPRLAEKKQVDSALTSAGIDIARLQADLKVHRESIERVLARNDSEARELGLHGTPGVLVGRMVASGISDLKSLQSAVALARGSGH